MARKQAAGSNGLLGKVLRVEWEDAWSNSSRYYEQEDVAFEGGMAAVLYGECISDTPKGVAVAMEYFPDRSGDYPYRTAQFVPRAMIRRVEVIGAATPRRDKGNGN